MSESLKADSIRQRMATVRREMAVSAGDLSVHAKRLADWRFYVRNYPWIVAGAAVALGYLVVPQRTRFGSPDLSALAKLLEHNQVVVERKPKAGVLNSLAASALAFAGNWALKLAMGYVSQRYQPPSPAASGLEARQGRF